MNIVILFLILFIIYLVILDISELVIFSFKEKPTLTLLIVCIISILMLAYGLKMINIFTETLSMI